MTMQCTFVIILHVAHVNSTKIITCIFDNIFKCLLPLTPRTLKENLPCRVIVQSHFRVFRVGFLQQGPDGILCHCCKQVSFIHEHFLHICIFFSQILKWALVKNYTSECCQSCKIPRLRKFMQSYGSLFLI